MYENTSNGDLYQKSGGVWNLVDNITGPTGATGATGAAGTNGTNGQGVPTGGSTGQYLNKIDGTDYNTQWSTLNATAVGLGNVTNDAQLKRAGADWSGFTAQTPVLPDDVVLIEQATGGAKRIVTAADLSKAAISYYGFVLVPITGIGSTPVNVFTTGTLPVGNYIMSFTAAFGVALSGGATTFTFDVTVVSGTVAAIAGFAGKPGHTFTIGQQGSAGITALPFSQGTNFTNSNQNSLTVYSAILTVSSPAVITIDASLNTTTTGFVRAGSFLQFAR
jgi:hypothetical protein